MLKYSPKNLLRRQLLQVKILIPATGQRPTPIFSEQLPIVKVAGPQRSAPFRLDFLRPLSFLQLCNVEMEFWTEKQAS